MRYLLTTSDNHRATMTTHPGTLTHPAQQGVLAGTVD